MNKNEIPTNETEYMNTLYDDISEALHSLVDIQNEVQCIDSEKLQKELEENNIGWEGKTKELWYNRLDEAIRALSFVKPN